jgi:hypothetical protein
MVVDAAGHAYVGNFGFDLMAGDRATETVLVGTRRIGQRGGGRAHVPECPWVGDTPS